MAAMMKLASDRLDFVAELAVVVVDVAMPTDSAWVVGVGDVTPRVMLPSLQSSVKHGHTVELTLGMGKPSWDL